MGNLCAFSQDYQKCNLKTRKKALLHGKFIFLCLDAVKGPALFYTPWPQSSKALQHVLSF